MSQNLQGMRVAILVTDFFEESELAEPMKALQYAGAETVIVSPREGEVQGVNHTEMGNRFPVGLTLERADAAEFDAVVLPGGALNADALRMEEKAREFVREIDQEGKPVAVICHGSWLLVSAGLVRGRRITSYHTIQDDLKNAGALWENAVVVRDRNWVSSRQPGDLPSFNREMISLFSEHSAAEAPTHRKPAEEVRI